MCSSKSFACGVLSTGTLRTTTGIPIKADGLGVRKCLAFLSVTQAGTAPRAVEVRDWLVSNGWDDVFLDLDAVRGLAPGERWQNALRAAADRCDAVVFLISLDWLNSRWCLSEYLLAKQLGKRLFPVIIDDVEISALPADMAADHQAVDLVLDVQGWERLKQGLNGRVLMPKASAFRPADGHIRDSNL
ncbi:toll/interleukin-1 receptor domain-containing protein [Mesorhizobium sp.]|uniref:toll/interleukin-1 receptor domain-containing protein n=1 Tax=Mesorhizobium sp. TaxID=1871066 RepID=UPI002580F3A9|nr:toll/interleukin-1 receptor domain-containing protein [Mesorhizobium sp.]